MGRKSRAKQSMRTAVVSAYTNKKEVDRLVQKLISACMVPTARKDEWETFLQIHDLVERIRQNQNNAKSKTGDRLNQIASFQNWLRANGIIVEHLALEDYGPDIGIGLKALKDFEEAEPLIEIPYNLMITVEKAKESYLGDFIESKKILTEMPNIALAIYLHCERFNPESFYRPYIDVLPGDYDTTLYFSPSEMEYLKGSTALYHAIIQYKSIARQYGIFYNMMHGDKLSPDIKRIPQSARNEFTFDAYRWAVSSVSTRLNKVALRPKQDSCSCCHHDEADDSTFALIPLWDMMNHSAGEISTDCDPEKELCVSYAMKNFKTGDQVTICYGNRDNTAFLIYNGFILEDNKSDKVEIELGVSPNDKLYAKKVRLLEKLRVRAHGSFMIYQMVDNMPIAPDLMAFLRVFHMTEEDLDKWNLHQYLDRQHLQEMFSPSEKLDEIELKIWKFLENRISLLLLRFKSDKEVEELLSNADISHRAKLAIKLQKESKRVLVVCREFCKDYPLHREQFQKVDSTAVNTTEIVNDDEGGGEKMPECVDLETLNKVGELELGNKHVSKQHLECGDCCVHTTE